MVYTEEDYETVDSGMTCSGMGCTHNKLLRAEHLIPGAPPINKPSQNNDSDTGLTHTEEEPQKTYSINSKRYVINNKLGTNYRWEL